MPPNMRSVIAQCYKRGGRSIGSRRRVCSKPASSNGTTVEYTIGTCFLAVLYLIMRRVQEHLRLRREYLKLRDEGLDPDMVE